MSSIYNCVLPNNSNICYQYGNNRIMSVNQCAGGETDCCKLGSSIFNNICSNANTVATVGNVPEYNGGDVLIDDRAVQIINVNAAANKPPLQIFFDPSEFEEEEINQQQQPGLGGPSSSSSEKNSFYISLALFCLFILLMVIIIISVHIYW